MNKHLVCSNNGVSMVNLPLQVDRIFISHYHHPEDGFPNLEEIDVEAQSDDQSSSSSIVHKVVAAGDDRRFQTEVGDLLSGKELRLRVEQEIDKLWRLSQSATISAEVRRYLQNITVFLRLERGVAGGVSPYATSQFELLTRSVTMPSHLWE